LALRKKIRMKPEHRWLSKYDEPKYWSTFSPIYFKSLPFIFGLYFNLNDNKLRKFLKTRKGKTIDLGCGNGRFLIYADVGVDFSKEMLKRAKRTRKDVVLASILDLPFKDKSFDTAFMADTSIIIRPTERKKAYKEARRVTECFYDFLAEDRTILPFMMSIFQSIPLPLKVTAYLALLFSFPIDRVRKLVISRGDFATP
jgi:SAM-dependent methyltransferase